MTTSGFHTHKGFRFSLVFTQDVNKALFKPLNTCKIRWFFTHLPLTTIIFVEDIRSPLPTQTHLDCGRFDTRTLLGPLELPFLGHNSANGYYVRGKK